MNLENLHRTVSRVVGNGVEPPRAVAIEDSMEHMVVRAVRKWRRELLNNPQECHFPFLRIHQNEAVAVAPVGPTTSNTKPG